MNLRSNETLTKEDFPLFLYLYNKDGKYEEPILITSRERLFGIGIKTILNLQRNSKLEAVMTDNMDRTLFHMKDGEILFPKPSEQSDKIFN